MRKEKNRSKERAFFVSCFATINRPNPFKKIRDHEFDFLKVPHEQAKEVTMMIK
jgi:hypothetical protein